MTRKFKIRLLFFAVLLILINTALDQAFKAFSVYDILNRKMDEQFAAYDDTLKYLAFGNSHNCINTHILNDCFNYGSPSENYIQSYYKLKYILEESGKKPEYLLLQSDVSSYGKKISERYEYNSYWIKYIDFLELARVKNDARVLWKWHEGKFFSYAGNYQYIQLSIVYRIKMKKIDMYRGFRPHRDFKNFANELNKQKSARDKANLINSREDYFDPAIRYYFIKILELCQQHNVKVILIRYPIAKEFDEEERKIVPADKLYAEVDSIAAQYPCFTGTLDYHDLYFDHPEYFFDPDHLNVKGSDLLTEKLAQDLKVKMGY